MQINDPIAKGRCAGRQVQFPHSSKVFSLIRCHLVFTFPKVFSPTEQCFVIVPPKALHIQSIKIIIRQDIDNFPETRYRTAWKNIFSNPGIPRVLPKSTDIMKLKQSPRGQDSIHIPHKPFIIASLDMFYHSHTDYSVKFHS